MTTLPQRADVAQEYTWKLESIFPSLEAWEQSFSSVERDLPGLAKYQGRLGESAATLQAWLSESERITPVSYTHLDVYKRQTNGSMNSEQAVDDANKKIIQIFEELGLPQ